jgi:hypothetical protein
MWGAPCRERIHARASVPVRATLESGKSVRLLDLTAVLEHMLVVSSCVSKHMKNNLSFWLLQIIPESRTSADDQPPGHWALPYNGLRYA